MSMRTLKHPELVPEGWQHVPTIENCFCFTKHDPSVVVFGSRNVSGKVTIKVGPSLKELGPAYYGGLRALEPHAIDDWNDETFVLSQLTKAAGFNLEEGDKISVEQLEQGSEVHPGWIATRLDWKADIVEYEYIDEEVRINLNMCPVLGGIFIWFIYRQHCKPYESYSGEEVSIGFSKLLKEYLKPEELRHLLELAYAYREQEPIPKTLRPLFDESRQKTMDALEEAQKM